MSYAVEQDMRSSFITWAIVGGVAFGSAVAVFVAVALKMPDSTAAYAGLTTAGMVSGIEYLMFRAEKKQLRDTKARIKNAITDNIAINTK